MALLDRFITSRYNLIRVKYTPNITITPASSRLDIDTIPRPYDSSNSNLSKLDSRLNIDGIPAKYRP